MVYRSDPCPVMKEVSWCVHCCGRSLCRSPPSLRRRIATRLGTLRQMNLHDYLGTFRAGTSSRATAHSPRPRVPVSSSSKLTSIISIPSKPCVSEYSTIAVQGADRCTPVMLCMWVSVSVCLDAFTRERRAGGIRKHGPGSRLRHTRICEVGPQQLHHIILAVPKWHRRPLVDCLTQIPHLTTRGARRIPGEGGSVVRGEANASVRH